MLSKPPTCEGCPRFLSGQGFVPAEGPWEARLVVIGEQPGAQEVQEGRPFVGPSGKALEKALVRAGTRREAVLITNVRWCGPPSYPESVKVRTESIEFCRRVHLQNILDSLTASYHHRLLVGADALEAFTGLTSSVKTHGSIWTDSEVEAMKNAKI